MERNVSCLNSRAIIGYVERHYPEFKERLLSDLDPFFDTVENLEEFLSDEHNWISQHVCAEMFKRVRQYSKNSEVARDIGCESITHRHFGYVENIFIKGIGHPYLAILRAPAINAKFNKTKIVEIVKSDWSHAIIRFKWFKDIGSTKDICLYNQGIYEAIPIIWRLPLAKVTEHKCFFEGDEYCEFSFEWVKKSFRAIIYGMFTHRKEMLKNSLAELEQEKELTERKYREVETLNIELYKKIEQLTSLDACSKATTSILDIDKLLDVVMALIVNIMQFDRALIMLVDDENQSLVPVKTAGGSENALKQLQGYTIPLNRTNNILTRVVNSGIAQCVRDVDHSFLRKENIILKKFNPQSFVAVPLITRNKVIGVMAAERIRGLDDFSSKDLDFVMNFCNQIAITIENARLIEGMKKSFESSILSLATALDAKDPYTHGHSNRVASYSTLVASRMEMDKDRIENIRLMALMHDIGKIGIPDSIINKPGKLTSEEYMSVKQHPVVSLNIIESLLTNKTELRTIISHHERYDGLGYPNGLAGKKIPVEARILALADSFDAMTTKRPYRATMSKEEALAEIERNKGSQFCPETARIFIDVISSLPEDSYVKINERSEEDLPIT